MKRTKLEPMKPAPPVTTSLTMSPPCRSRGRSAERDEPVDRLGHAGRPVRQPGDGALAGESREGRPGRRPAQLGGRDRYDLDVDAGELYHLTGQLAPGAVAAAGHVVEAGGDALSQRLVDGRGEVAGVAGRADLVVHDPERLARCGLLGGDGEDRLHEVLPRVAEEPGGAHDDAPHPAQR